MSTAAIADITDHGDPRRWKALAVLSLVSFMLVLDITVVNVALPQIQIDLKMSRSGLTWVVDSYVLMAGGLLLLGGRLGDLLGKRRMFFVGVILFAVASILSGAAQNSAMLIFSRFLQGAGEAFAAPAAFGLVALLFVDPIERTKAIGIFGGVAGLGGTLGPIISGLLIEISSWRWIFFINVPVAVFAVVAVANLVDESRADKVESLTDKREVPDYAGAIMSTAGLAGIVYGLIQAATDPWGSSKVLFPLLGGIALLIAFVMLEAKIPNPLVPLRFFQNRTRVTANLVTLFFSSVFFTMFFLLTLYFQQVHHFSALRTGMAYLPFGLAIGAAIGMSTVLLPKFGIKTMLTIGFVLYSAGIAWLSGITIHSSYVSRPLPGLVLMALGSGLCFACFQNAAVHEVSRQDAGLASGVQSAVQQVGGAVGLAVLATIALRHATGEIKRQVNPAVAYIDGLGLTFKIGAVVMLFGAVLVTVLFERVEIHPADELVPIV